MAKIEINIFFFGENLMENLGKNLFAMHQKENLGNIPP
jgi:hypothetical protein